MADVMNVDAPSTAAATTTTAAAAAAAAALDEGPPASYHYLVSAHRPTAVTAAAVGAFTGPQDVNLVVSRGTRIEVHRLTPDGLQGVIDVPIYGRVATLRLMRPPGERKDLLFICTERHKFCLLAFEEASGSLVTRAAGDASDRVGRPADAGQLGAVDPRCRAIALHLYDGLLKVIPCEGARGELREAFNVRLEEQGVIDIVFLHSSSSASASSGAAGPSSGSSTSKPTIALLHEDATGQRHVRTYEVDARDRDLADGPWSLSGCDPGATTLAAVPAALGGGALVVGGASVAYVNAGNSHLTVPSFACTRGFAVTAVAPVDEDGARWLLGDGGGGLSLLLLAHDGAGKVTALRLERLGTVSLPSCLCYLDNGVVFVGSAGGDSQLVRLCSEPVNAANAAGAPSTSAAAAGKRPLLAAGQQAAAEQEEESFVEVLETFPNIGPIVDMAVLDVDRGGAASALVTASGVGRKGSLRLVRNGVGVAEQASAWDLPGVTRVWGLRGPLSSSTSSPNEDTLLLLSFVGETRLLEVDPEDGALGEAATTGALEAREPTLAAAAGRGSNASPSSPMCLLQATPSGVRCVSGPAREAVAGSPWLPGNGAHVVAAAANDALQALVATSDGRLVLLQGGGGDHGLSVVSEARAPREAPVSCLDISPLTPAGATDADEARLRDAPAGVALVGSWDVRASLLSLPALAVVAEEALGGDAVPRSAALAAMESGLGSGNDEDGGGGAKGKKAVAAAAGDTKPSSLSALGAHALMSLGDGRVLSWRLVEGPGGKGMELSERRSVALGSRAALLAPFRRGGGGAAAAAAAGGRASGDGGSGSSSSSSPPAPSTAVLAACDRPAVIHCSNRKLVFSNVNAPSASPSAGGGGEGGGGGGGGARTAATTSSSADSADGVTHFSRFNSSAFPGGGALAIARARCLSIGTVDSIQRLHVRSVPLGEQPRRLAHQAETGTLAVTVDGTGNGGGNGGIHENSTPPDCVRLLDDATFEPLDRFFLDRNEVACSIASVELGGGGDSDGGDAEGLKGGGARRRGKGKGEAAGNGGGGDVAMTDAAANTPAAAAAAATAAAASTSTADGPFYVVGTAFSLPNEAEPTAGRLLVLRVAPATRSLELVAQRTVRGGAYTVQGFKGMVLAGVNARVSLYAWRPRGREGEEEGGEDGGMMSSPAGSGSGSGTPVLRHVASHSGHILALYTAVRGDLIVVGDLMRSVQVLAWRPARGRGRTGGSIEPVARDYHAAWMTAVAAVDADTFVGAENSLNLFVLKKASEAAAAALSDEERARLETTGEVHVGEFINKFVAGSLVMRAPERGEGSGGGGGGENGAAAAATTTAAGATPANAANAAATTSSLLPSSASLSLSSSRPAQDTLLFGTIGGVIGVLHPLTRKQFEWFDRLQRAMRRRVRGVGGFCHAEWRAFSNERVSSPCRGVVDGDLVEQFLELGPSDAKGVAEEMGGGETAESVAKAVDELSRACH